MFKIKAKLKYICKYGLFSLKYLSIFYHFLGEFKKVNITKQ